MLRLINFKKYRSLIIVIAIITTIGIGLNNINWVLKILYPMHYDTIIKKYSSEYGLDEYLVAAIIKAESKFDEKAKSIKDARGLMQISEITGEWASKELKINNYDKEDLFIPSTNVRIGCWYLDKLRNEFDGNLQLMLAAYNGGSGNVNKWLKDKEYSEDGKILKDIPFKETKTYVERVIKNYKVYRILYR